MEQVCGGEAQHRQADLNLGLACLQRDKWATWVASPMPAWKTVCGSQSQEDTESDTLQGGNKAVHRKKMLLCQMRFLGNNSFNYFNAPNHSALLTFRTCLISSSDFRNERADICWWDSSAFGSCLTFQPLKPSLCFCLTKWLSWCPSTFLSLCSAHTGHCAWNPLSRPDWQSLQV